MKIAVYMGSFNPMHIGHLAVIRYLLDEALFDKVYLIVSPQNPFKDTSLAASAKQRYDDAVKAVHRNNLQDRVLVDDIEMSMGYPSYSIRTLDALKAREPHNRFVLVVGGDNLHELPIWREGIRIMTDYGVVVYPRDGFNIVHDAAILRLQHKNQERLFSPTSDNTGKAVHRPLHIKLLRNAPLVDISSTQIREMVLKGEDVSKLLA